MRRWILRTLVFLLLGAIVNVAVAWGLAGFKRLAEPVSMSSLKTSSDFHYVWRPLPQPMQGGWTLSSDSAVGSVRYVAIGGSLRLNSQDETPELMALYPSWIDWPTMLDEWARTYSKQISKTQKVLPRGRVVIDARGWPLLSLRSRWDSYLPDGRLWLGAIALPPHSLEFPSQAASDCQRALPLTPLWPGFAINTVFYAVVLWLLFAGPFVWRRRRRIRRGLCPKCAYDLRGTPEATSCPECGTPVNRIAR